MKFIRLIVCDLDGTLCDVKHRQHLAQAGAWDEFHEGLEQDTPRLQVASFLHSAVKEGISLIFLTGRPAAYEARTKAWLEDNCRFFLHDDYQALLMRPNGQFGSDTVVKQELLEAYLETVHGGQLRKEDILILDDRDKLVAHFRDLGYETWQVNEGAF